MKRLPAFGADAAVSVTPTDGGYAVEFPEATAPEPFMYRIRCERKGASGAFPASCNLIFNYESPGSSFRVAGLRLLRG